MASEKSHVVQALAAARLMRRPATLLTAMLARAERAEADPMGGLVAPDPAAGLVPFLAPQAPGAVARRPKTASRIAAAERPAAYTGRTPAVPTKVAKALRDVGSAVAEQTGRAAVEAARRERSAARPRLADPQAVLDHAGEEKSLPAPGGRAGRREIAAARDRLRQADRAGPPLGAEPGDVRRALGEAAAGLAASGPGEAAAGPAASRPVGPGIVAPAVARAMEAGTVTPHPGSVAEALPAPAARIPRDPGPAEAMVRPGMPPEMPEPSASASPLAAPSAAPVRTGPVEIPDLPLRAAEPPVIPGSRPAAKTLDDAALALLEEAYRHGVDVT